MTPADFRAHLNNLIQRHGSARALAAALGNRDFEKDLSLAKTRPPRPRLLKALGFRRVTVTTYERVGGDLDAALRAAHDERTTRAARYLAALPSEPGPEG